MSKEFSEEGCLNEDVRNWCAWWREARVQPGFDVFAFRKKCLKRFSAGGGGNGGVIGLKDLSFFAHMANEDNMEFERALHVMPVRTAVGVQEVMCVLDGTPPKGWVRLFVTGSSGGVHYGFVRVGRRDVMFPFVLGEFVVGEEILNLKAGVYLGGGVEVVEKGNSNKGV